MNTKIQIYGYASIVTIAGVAQIGVAVASFGTSSSGGSAAAAWPIIAMAVLAAAMLAGGIGISVTAVRRVIRPLVDAERHFNDLATGETFQNIVKDTLALVVPGEHDVAVEVGAGHGHERPHRAPTDTLAARTRPMHNDHCWLLTATSGVHLVEERLCHLIEAA